MEEVVRYLVNHYPDAGRGERNRDRTGRRPVARRIADRGPQALNDGDDIVTSDSPSLTERLAAYWARRLRRDTPNDVVDGIKDNILDTLAVALVGATTPEVSGVVDALSRLLGRRCRQPRVGDRHTPHPGARRPRQRNVGARPRLRRRRRARPRGVDRAARGARRGRKSGEYRSAGDRRDDRRLRHRLSDPAALGGFAAHTDRGWHSSGTMGSFAAAAAARNA